MVQYKTKKTLTIIGTILYHIGISSILSLSNISIFLISYLRYYNRSLTPEHSLFFFPLFAIALFLCNTIYNLLDKILKVHFIIIIGSILIETALLIIMFCKNYYLYLLSMPILGLGFGIGNIAATKNAMRFSATSKIIHYSLSFVSIVGKGIFTLIAFFYTNRAHHEPRDRFFFPFANCKHYINFVIFQIILIGITTLISIGMIFKETALKDVKQDYVQMIEDEDIDIDLSNSQDIITTQREMAVIASPNFPVVQKDKNPLIVSKFIEKIELSQVYKSFQFWRIFIINFLATFLEQIISNTYMIFGIRNEIPITVLIIGGVSLCVFHIIGYPIVNKICNAFKFRNIMITKTIISIAYGFAFYYSVKFITFFGIAISLCGFLFSLANIPIFHHIVRVYNSKYAVIIYGYISFAESLSTVIGGIAVYFIVSIYEFNREYLYLYVYIMGMCGNAMLMILLIFEGDKEFIYNDKYNKL